MVGISVGRPQRPQLGNGVDAALVLLMCLHELLVVDVQIVQNLQPLLLVLSDEVKNALAEVLNHVLSLSLPLFLIIFFPFELAVLLLLR